MSSIEPNDRGGEVDSCQEVACGFVVAGCDGSVLLEPDEEILDQMPFFVDMPVKLPRRLPVGPGRDDGRFSSLGERLDHALVSIECLVGDQRIGLHIGQQSVGTDQIMGLAARQMEADRVSKGVDQRVDLRAQSTAGPPDRLVFAGFFLAPALCWWARTMVLSIIAYSLSASSARC